MAERIDPLRVEPKTNDDDKWKRDMIRLTEQLRLAIEELQSQVRGN